MRESNHDNPLTPLKSADLGRQEKEQIWDSIIQILEKEQGHSFVSQRKPKRLQGVQSLMAGAAAVIFVGAVVFGVTQGHWLHSTTVATKHPNATKVIPPAVRLKNVSDIHMIDAKTGWAVQTNPNTHQNTVLRTTDRGQSWQNVTPPFLTAHPKEVQQYKGLVTDFLDSTHAYVAFSAVQTWKNGAMVDLPTVYVTSDGGKSWTSTGMSESSPDFVPVYVHFNTPSFGVVMNEFDTNGGDGFPVHQLYETTDGGKSWHVDANAPKQIPNKVLTYVNPGEMPTVNPVQGLTWVKMVNQQVGFTPGQTSPLKPNQSTMLYKTMDGGKTWAPVSLTIPRPKNLASVVIMEPSILPNGNIVVPVVVNYGTPATNYQLSIYRSTDGGNTFTKVNQKRVQPNDPVYFGGFFNTNDGWFWIGGSILTTTDGGKTFKSYFFNHPSTASSVDFQSTTTGYVSSDDGLWKTTDSGQTWMQVFQMRH